MPPVALPASNWLQYERPRSDMDDWYGKFSAGSALERPDANCKSPIHFQHGFHNYLADILLETAALVMNRYLRAALTQNQVGPVPN